MQSGLSRLKKMQKKHFLSVVIVIAMFFCFSPGKIIAKSPLLVLDDIRPSNPKVGEEIRIAIRIQVETKHLCGAQYISSMDNAIINHMYVEFGDGQFGVLKCTPREFKTEKDNVILSCQGIFYHAYSDNGNYVITTKARYAVPECPEWSEISFPIRVGDDATPPPGLFCGNGAINVGEDCDGSDLNNKTCQDFNDPRGKKYASGSLSCYPPGHATQCKFDTSKCVVAGCGNNIIEAGEQCDGANLDKKVCSDLKDSSGKNYIGGTLSCYPPGHKNQCTFDTSRCVSSSPPSPPPLPTGYDDPLIWDSIIQFILYFTNFIFNICLGLSVLMILIGAFVMVVGGGNPLKREKAKKIIIWALIGFSVTLISRGIFQLFKLVFRVKDF